MMLALSLLVGCEPAVDPAERLAMLDRCLMDPERTPEAPVPATLNGEVDDWWIGIVDQVTLPAGGGGRVEELELWACRGNGFGVEHVYLWGGLDLDRVWVESYAGRHQDQITGADDLFGPGDFWVDVRSYEGNRTPDAPAGSLSAVISVDTEAVVFDADVDLVWGE